MLKTIWIALIAVATVAVLALVVNEIASNVENDEKTSGQKTEVSYS